jgi:hypothetical protein
MEARPARRPRLDGGDDGDDGALGQGVALGVTLVFIGRPLPFRRIVVPRANRHG